MGPAVLQHIHNDKVLESAQRLEWELPGDKNMTVSGVPVQPQDVVVSKNETQYGLSKFNLG